MSAKEKKKASESEKDLSSLFGDDCIYFDGDISSIGRYEVIRTGSPSLDYALGIGGLPRGRIVQFAGKESSGKTLLSLLVMKNWLDENPTNTAMFVDAEFTYDPKWAKGLGLDTSRIIVAKTNEAKKIFEGLVGKTSVNKTTGKASKGTKGVLDLVKEGVDPKFKNLGVIVVDSVAAMNTPMEAVADVGKQNMAPMPRFLATELKKLTPAAADANVLIIFINQIRTDPGVMYGNPESSPGGRALKHACSVMVNLAPLMSADSKIEDSKGNMIGHTVRAKVQKNKVGAPFRSSEYAIKYGVGIINKNKEIVDLGIKIGLIGRPSNRAYVIDDQKFDGRNSIEEYFSDEKIRISFEERCRKYYTSDEFLSQGTDADNSESSDGDDSEQDIFDTMLSDDEEA
jgi:recombination protein RecA